MQKPIIVLDDDASVLGAVGRVLNANGLAAKTYDTVERFLREAPLDDALCLMLDINLDGRCGIELNAVDAFWTVTPGHIHDG